jgi:predicted phosphodiesterase
MRPEKWTKKETLTANLMYNAGKDVEEISSKLGTRTINAVIAKIKREGWLKKNTTVAPELNPVVKTAVVEDPLHELADVKAEIPKDYVAPYFVEAGVVERVKGSRKILSLSDIHFPMHNKEAIQTALDRDGDADILVLNGDLFEGYMWSSFEKNKVVAALAEYTMVFGFVEEMAKRFPKVVLVDGNHDVRVGRSLQASGVHPACVPLLRPNLMLRIVQGERLDLSGNLVEKVNFTNIVYQPSESWYVRVGKSCFIHPHAMGLGTAPGMYARKFGERLKLRYGAEVDSIFSGHTHQIYKGVINGTLYVEQGCLAGYQSYAWSPSSKYTGNSQTGYAVVYQDKDGNTDFNLSGPVYLGETFPAKKVIL